MSFAPEGDLLRGARAGVVLGDDAQHLRGGGAGELADERGFPALGEHALPHREGAQGCEGHETHRVLQLPAQRGRPDAVERRHDGVGQVSQERLTCLGLQGGHRAECLEGVEDVFHVPVSAGAQALQGIRADVVQVEPSLDSMPDRLCQPGDRDRLFHAVDRGQDVRHD
ncbi:MAG: hypothetical protein ACRDP7_45325 [Trebonia sp.]